MLDTRDLGRKILERKAKRVLLQLPEGLIWKGPEIADVLREMGIEADIWAEPTFGACDITPEVAESLGYDLLVHVGHVKFIKPIPDRNVLYYPIHIPVSPSSISGWEKIREREIDLLTTAQHLKSMEEFKEFLEGMGKNVKSMGYCLGCWVPPLKGEAVVFVGSGNFHALAPVLMEGKRVYVADVEKGVIRELDATEFIRLQKLREGLAMQADTFGIVVSTKHGQMEIERARRIKRMLEERGKRADIIVMNFISRERLEMFKKDMYVNTACPRIEDDGWIRMINADHLEEILNR